jgi:hypothetical protein
MSFRHLVTPPPAALYITKTLLIYAQDIEYLHLCGWIDWLHALR